MGWFQDTLSFKKSREKSLKISICGWSQKTTLRQSISETQLIPGGEQPLPLEAALSGIAIIVARLDYGNFKLV